MAVICVHFFFRFVWSPKRDNKLRRSLFYTLLHITFLFLLSEREKRKEKDQRQLISLLDIYGEYQRASAKHQRDSWESLLLTSAVDDEKVEDQHLLLLGNHRHTHSLNEHTHLLYVCVHILRPLSLFFSYPAHRWLPEELERRAVWVSFLISFSFFFSFEMLLFWS